VIVKRGLAANIRGGYSPLNAAPRNVTFQAENRKANRELTAALDRSECRRLRGL